MANAATPLRALIVEDSADDAALVLRELRKSGYAPVSERVETAEAMRAALRNRPWDIIISDYMIPGFGGLEALVIAKEGGLDLPFIVVSGKVSEEMLVEAMKAGATDFVLKDRLGRLGAVVKRELVDAAARRGMRQAQIEWRMAFDSVRDALFIHDSEFRIVRANLAYAALACMPIKKLIGQHYWEAFPKLGGPLPACRAGIDAQQDATEEEFTLPDGNAYLSRSFRLLNDRSEYYCSLHVLQDVTERNRVRDALEKSERHYRKLIEGGSDAFFLMDAAGKLLYRSPSGKQVTGWEDEDVIGKGITQYVVAEDLPLVQTAIADTIRNPGKEVHIEFRLTRKDGNAIEAEASGRNLLADPDVGGIVVTMRDITERKRSEIQLRESETRFRGIFERAKDVIYMIDAAGIFVALSPSFEKITGWTVAEWLHKPFLSIVHPDDRARAIEVLRQTIVHGIRSEFEMRIGNKTGEFWIGEFTVGPLEIGGSTIVFGIGRDITERKRGEEALRASRDLLVSIVENVPIRVFWKDAELRYLGCNSLFARDAGMSRPEDLLGKDDFQMGWREQAELYRADDRKVIDSNTPKLGYEEPQTTPDGRTIWIRTSKVPLRDAGGKVIGMLGIYDDITDRKRSERALVRLNRALKTLSKCNETLVHATDEARLLGEMCRTVVENGGYRMAWVGFAEQDAEKSIRPVARFGFEEGYLERAAITWADTERGRGPSGAAVREGRTQFVSNTDADPRFAPWRTDAISRNYGSAIALPLLSGGNAFGVFSIYAEEHDAFDAEEITLLEELASDLAFGIDALHMRAAQEQGAWKLRRSLEATVQAIATTLEMRDAYTAGHQRRVAELSVAIAREMGLPQENIDGLHFAAVIHDLGKISVPAEILSKPGRLSSIEFSLVKAHAQIGYEILKGIDFPWPVAQLVLQHHERLDGSGYPQGLKGDAMLPEAKILAVADVVEAMSSHRPYRPGLGIDSALDEITRNRSKLYDPGAADACVKLFREKGFAFSV